VRVSYTNLSVHAVHARGLVDVVAGTCAMSIVGGKTYDIYVLGQGSEYMYVVQNINRLAKCSGTVHGCIKL
jgi:hypothetical protein